MEGFITKFWFYQKADLSKSITFYFPWNLWFSEISCGKENNQLEICLMIGAKFVNDPEKVLSEKQKRIKETSSDFKEGKREGDR